MSFQWLLWDAQSCERQTLPGLSHEETFSGNSTVDSLTASELGLRSRADALPLLVLFVRALRVVRFEPGVDAPLVVRRQLWIELGADTYEVV